MSFFELKNGVWECSVTLNPFQSAAEKDFWDKFNFKHKSMPHAHKTSMSEEELTISDNNLEIIRDFYKKDYEWRMSYE